MNCEESENLISARIDGEISRDDDVALDAHLAGCEECRRRTAEMELQDGALLRAFAPRRDIAAAVASRVGTIAAGIGAGSDISISSPAECGTGGPPVSFSRHGHHPTVRTTTAHSHQFQNLPIGRLSSLAAAAAIGFIAAMLFANLRHKSPLTITPGYPATAAFQPVAHLTLATGKVFACPPDQNAWREMGMHDAIAVGAAVRTTPESKCELQLSDGSCVRLDSGTEARFTAGRAIRVNSGQVCSALTHDAAPIVLTAGTTNITAGPATDVPRTRLDLQCTRSSANVCVQSGSAQVAAGELHAVVHAGEVLRAPWSPAVFACTPIPDPLLTAQWQDDLLLQKPADDPDLTARLDQLLEQIAADRKLSGYPGTAEQLLRARGSAWCPSLALSLRNHPKAADRQIAAGLLADLAPANSTLDLIALLDDQDGLVRRDAASALGRLTGQTLGYLPEHCETARDPAVIAAWREWWEASKSRY